MKPRDLALASLVLLIPALIWAAVRLSGGGPPPDESAAAPTPEELALELPDERVVPPPGLDLPAGVERLLSEERYWRASRQLRDHVTPGSDPALVLLAARTESAWGGWQRVTGLLQGRDWLDEADGGYGWFLLGRARATGGDWAGAAEAQARYLAVAPGTPETEGVRAVARLRQGVALLRAGRTEEGVGALEEARARVPSAGGWIAILAAEALAQEGDTARVRRLVEDGVPESPLRSQRARVRAHTEAGDAAGARALAERYRAAAGTEAARTEFAHLAAEAARAAGREEDARALLREAVAEAPGTAGALRAARMLLDLPAPPLADRLAAAAVFDRHGARARAAAEYRAWLAAGDGTAAERADVRLRLGRSLFAAGSHAEVETALAPLARTDAAEAAEALHLIGRAQFRRGNQTAAVRTWQRAAERFPTAPTSGDGLFFIADHQHDNNQATAAAAHYRRVAEGWTGSFHADLAAMRLGGIAFLARDWAGAAATYERYRARNPEGGAWLQATYWAGRAYQAAGDSARAAERYREVRAREPLSYYALLSARRLGEAFWDFPLAPPPAEATAAARRVNGWMHTVDVLRAAGLEAEAEAEADRRVHEAGDDLALLYPLAEQLNARGYTIQGIRIGQRLQREAETPDLRMLRILYPFPYREILTAEARDRGLDPHLVAALTRQESMFKDRITSPAGARGLMQLMPGTGRLLAPGAGIGQWDAELLYNPEINVALGTRYLADQMRRYGGSLPSVFSAYNAGPQRVERWRRYPEFGNEELFTERIPFLETRSYVKILTRNRAIYDGLYGE